VIAGIEQRYHDIHAYYKRFCIGESYLLDYTLSARVEDVSKKIWQLFKIFPLAFPGFDRLSEGLRDMAIEIQMGPCRELYYTMPRRRYR
jgi:hypothetical protein